MPDIFISYRRDDSAAYAGRLYDRLSAHFGQDHVFMDFDTIELGEDFAAAIRERVAACDALVAVIGKGWLASSDGEGRRRLDNPRDFVRLEISSALDRDIRVIPVLVSGSLIPIAASLPESLSPLAERTDIELHDASFHRDVNKLIDALEGPAATGPVRPSTRKQYGFLRGVNQLADAVKITLGPSITPLSIDKTRKPGYV